MDRKPGRIGYMSTQRREIRSTPATKTSRQGPRNRWRHSICGGLSGETISGSNAGLGCAIASGGTAPPGLSAWLATISLLSGYRNVQLVLLFQLVRLVELVQFVQFVRLQDLRLGSPPFGAGLGAVIGTRANHGSSLPHIPSPSGLARFHFTLPRVPAGKRRWAERYDGKGNMHLQYAA
jgi:hypothetical protein